MFAARVSEWNGQWADERKNKPFALHWLCFQLAISSFTFLIFEKSSFLIGGREMCRPVFLLPRRLTATREHIIDVEVVAAKNEWNYFTLLKYHRLNVKSQEDDVTSPAAKVQEKRTNQRRIHPPVPFKHFSTLKKYTSGAIILILFFQKTLNLSLQTAALKEEKRSEKNPREMTQTGRLRGRNMERQWQFFFIPADAPPIPFPPRETQDNF